MIPHRFIIAGSSMRPNFDDRQEIAFFGKPEDIVHGSIIAFRNPATGKVSVKRVIGLAGDRLEIKLGRISRNGTRLPYAPISALIASEDGWPILFNPSDRLPEVSVPAGHVWVMGDNRTDSLDSRSFGPLPVSSIIAVMV